MVYSPSTYLVSAAVAAVALQMQQTMASSIYYDPVTVSDTTNELGDNFPGLGADVAEQDCAFTVEVDPTLPDITTIPQAPVAYVELLANSSTHPVEPIHTKVGTVLMSHEVPDQGANQDAYVTSNMPTTVAGNADKHGPKDCATGWEEPSKLVSGPKRRLDALPNQDIAKLEAHFGTKMEMNLAKLPTEGVFTPSPWPGPYWPGFQDSINVVWKEGEPCASEKYAKAFGYDVKEIKDKVSKNAGIDRYSDRPKCKTDADCKSIVDDENVCAIRDGASSGYCIPMWFGICHAWAPASILEAEPNCPVTHNGVTFQPLDIKALITVVYHGSRVPVVFNGVRYRTGSNETDEYGRYINSAVRDVNPGLFHISTANVLGLLNSTYVADVESGKQVWNQPVSGFKIYEQTAMSLEEAAQTFYGLQEYPWNAAAKSIVYVKMRLSWTHETYDDGGLVAAGRIDNYTTGAYYYYLLELDDTGDIIGGEWVYISDNEHIDYMYYLSKKPAANTVTVAGLSYAEVSMLLEKSAACSDPSSTVESSSSVSEGEVSPEIPAAETPGATDTMAPETPAVTDPMAPETPGATWPTWSAT